MPRTDANAMARYHGPKTDHDPTGPRPFEGWRRKDGFRYERGEAKGCEDLNDLMYDTPLDCLFDDDPENPRLQQTLEGLDKRDYGHWTQRQEDGRLAATGRGRRNRQ